MIVTTEATGQFTGQEDDGDYRIREVCENLWKSSIQKKYHRCHYYIKSKLKIHVFRLAPIKYVTIMYNPQHVGIDLHCWKWRSGSVEIAIQFFCWTIHLNDYGVLVQPKDWPKHW